MDRDSDTETMIPFEALARMGFPSFDEFKKNPDKWRKASDEIFSSVEASTQIKRQRRALKRQKFMWKDIYECDSLEKVQQIAKNEGFEPNDLEMVPLARQMDGTSQDGRLEIVIHFWPRDEYKALGGVCTNEDG